jgi:hypothetical protein
MSARLHRRLSPAQAFQPVLSAAGGLREWEANK